MQKAKGLIGKALTIFVLVGYFCRTTLGRAKKAGMTFPWVTGDSVYGNNPTLGFGVGKGPTTLCGERSPPQKRLPLKESPLPLLKLVNKFLSQIGND